MTTKLRTTKINPKPLEDDLRRMALTTNELIKFANRGFSEYKSVSITGATTANDVATVILADAPTGS